MAGQPVRLFRQDHRVCETLGLRIGRFAYSTDVITLPEDSLAQLEGLDTWVVGCLGRQRHPVHANVDRVCEWVARLRPRRTVLTHMSVELDWAWMAANLPAGIEAGHDGMVIDVPD
jgi:phosphoribosyl 1,2-cyclic phosphate phosphodiesterase